MIISMLTLNKILFSFHQALKKIMLHTTVSLKQKKTVFKVEQSQKAQTFIAL